MKSEMNVDRQAELSVAANADAGSKINLGRALGNHYKFECHDKDGNLKWVEEFDNLVVTVGLNDSLNKHLKGSSYTAAWYIGLTAASPTFAAGDTMASHSGWTEVTAYSESVRQTLTLGTVAAGSCDNSASKVVFTINANSTAIGGAFMAASSTKSETASILYGGGAFAEGNRTLASGDTLTGTITCATTAS